MTVFNSARRAMVAAALQDAATRRGNTQPGRT